MAKAKKSPKDAKAARPKKPAAAKAQPATPPPAAPRGISEEDAAQQTRELQEDHAARVAHRKAVGSVAAGYSGTDEEIARREQKSARWSKVHSAAEAHEALRTKTVAVWAQADEFEKGADGGAFVEVDRRKAGATETSITHATAALLTDARLGQPAIAGQWVRPVMQHGPAALTRTVADLVVHENLADLETNTLSWIGNRVSYYLRRALLLKELEAADWNLGAVGAALHMGGAGNVTKAIRDLGLSDELEKARAAGKAKRGVKRG